MIAPRVHFLGPRGEDEASQVWDAIELAAGFQILVVTSPHVAALSELRARIEATRPVLRLPLDTEVLESVEHSQGDEQVLWLDVGEDSARGLQVLNERRDVLPEWLPQTLILAGPPESSKLLFTVAPDLASVALGVRELNDEPVPITGTPGGAMRWLHISDLHLRGKSSWSRDRALEALLRDVATRKQPDPKLDFVLITGDLTHSGRRDEFEQAELFLKKLAEVVHLDLRESFILVPGNHDVDRGLSTRARRNLHRDLVGDLEPEETRQDVIAEYLGDADTMKILAAPLEPWRAFSERVLGPARTWELTRPWRVERRTVKGDDAALEVAFLALNSAWASVGDGEKGRLFLGAAQVREALEEASDAQVVVALTHHPLSWLHDDDGDEVRALFSKAGGVHLHLHGHLHKQRPLGLVGPDSGYLQFGAGAAWQGARWPNTCARVTILPSENKARMELFRYSPEDGGFWGADTGSQQAGASDGVIVMPISPRLASAAESDGAREQARATRLSRLREAVGRVQSQASFIGLSDHSQKPKADVAELYVPTAVDWETGAAVTEENRPADFDAFLASLLSPGSDTDPAARYVILGDPGSGKTTLARYLAAVLTGHHQHPGVQVSGEPLPLLVLVRDLVLYRREQVDPERRGILDFLVSTAAHSLYAKVTKDDLEAALAAGAAVLVIDGMDELGAESDREGLRDEILALATAWPRAPVLVTSRVVGYDRACLDNGFLQGRLQPFGDDELERFVRNWYAVREPRDPQARERSAAGLIARLHAEPAARALARNPLMATLIALVNQGEADLPGQRAKLYELILHLLLVTWPNTKKDRFTRISEDRQRRYLESIALRAIEGRSAEESPEEDREVSLARDALIGWIVEEAKTFEEPEDSARSDAEAWLDWLAARSGVLVEQSPGVFSFLHLTFLEYLAACAFERDQGTGGHEALARALIKKFSDPSWREVLLLVCGRRSAERQFVAPLVEEMPEGIQGTEFLLRGLREETDLTSSERALVVERAVKDAAGSHQWEGNVWPGLVRDVLRFGKLHREGLEAELRGHLSGAEGMGPAGVLGAAWLLSKIEPVAFTSRDRFPWARLPALLNTRGYRQVLSPLLATGAGRAALADSMPNTEILLSLSILSGQLETCSSLAVAVLQATLREITFATLQAKSLETTPATCDQSLPFIVSAGNNVWQPAFTIGSQGAKSGLAQEEESNSHLATDLAISDLRFPPNKPSSSLFFPGSALYDNGLVVARCGDLIYGDFVPHIANRTASSTADHFSVYFTNNFIGDFVAHFADLVSELFPGNSPHKITQKFPVLFSNDLAPLSEGSLLSSEPSMGRAIALETWCAMVTSHGMPTERASSYANFRGFRRWLFQTWAKLDSSLDPAPEPGTSRAGLYMALAWSQMTVTWLRPESAVLDRLLDARAADHDGHWLTRLFYHLCHHVMAEAASMLAKGSGLDEVAVRVHRESISVAVAMGREQDDGPLADIVANALGLNELQEGDDDTD